MGTAKLRRQFDGAIEGSHQSLAHEAQDLAANVVERLTNRDD